MRQIVTGLFETYDDARRAQDALLLKGFTVTDIELPVTGTNAGDALTGGGVLAGLERVVSSLFASRPLSAEKPTASTDDKEARAASMRFALQRGAVLIGVQVFDDAHATLARDTLIQQQAIQVDEHAPGWLPGADSCDSDALREHSALDELGISGLTDALRQHAGHWTQKTVPDDETRRARHDELHDGAPTADAPSSVPDEFLEYEEDFRDHHAVRYGNDDAPFERYQDAYRYGAVLAQDADNQGRAWRDIEPEARRGWETMVSGAAPHPAWELVGDAVRHGWERACAQGGGA